MFNALGYCDELVFRNMPEATGFFRTTIPIKRVLPDIFLPGAQKSGTTSLYSLLLQHPSIAEPQLKEPFYFGNDDRYPERVKQYRCNYPPAVKMNHLRRRTGRASTLDATTNYLDHPLAAERIKNEVPHAKAIILLRNPVDRAFSHYKMAVRNGLESLDFGSALKLEEERIASGKGRKHNYCRQRLGYRTRGEYAQMIKPWMDAFTPENLLVVRAEDFFENPAEVYAQVIGFLGLPLHVPMDFKPMNEGNKSEILDDNIRHMLTQHFHPLNAELENMLNRKFNWEAT